MAKSFNELVKNFAVLRNYVREFYVYGFKQREDFTEKSGRSYDNVRRRVESYLREYVDVEQQASGRALRLFIDPNEITENPMFAVWQAKSFTKNDIFLHFVLMDLFQEGVSLSVNQVLARIDEEYFVHFQDGFLVEALTLRKKLAEYVELGVLRREACGRAVYFSRVPCVVLGRRMKQAVQFFKEMAPLGVLGHYLLQQETVRESVFSYKHYFVMHTLEEQVFLDLLLAIREERWVVMARFGRKRELRFLPIKLLTSAQSGRQYVVGKSKRGQFFAFHRLDQIERVVLAEVATDFGMEKEHFDEVRKFMWSAGFDRRVVHELRVTLAIDEEREAYLLERIRMEGRHGTLTRVTRERFVFAISTYDLNGMKPFLRTFVGRIIALDSGDLTWERQFYAELADMYRLYFEEGTTVGDI
ncbi:WYL domain-containing protein [Listeria grandensis]|uniref:WYL domain-containing protein n=1 Tax=Listeria grandensis TaxID=1494963 RepID=UPI00164DD09C|nr:WYL domain-containing protein [Listeria grandensis]MBC6316336.1 WYL domain-containing protein [Listeria grandensis]